MRYANLIRLFKNWPQYFRFKWGRRTGSSLIFVLRSGIEVEVPTQLMVEFKEVFFADCYGRHLDQGSTVQHVVDIGANVGFFSLYAANRFPSAQIHSFEPVPANFRQLQSNIERNPSPKIELHHAAVGATSGRFSMHLNSDEEFTTSASLAHAGRGTAIEVECCGFASVLDRLPGGRCDFLKVDCEGAEYEILYGQSFNLAERIRHLAMECHPVDDEQGNTRAMAAFLQRQRFHVHVHGSMVYASSTAPAFGTLES